LEFGGEGGCKAAFQTNTPGEHEEKDSDPNKMM
jgi:hypothetical protein